METHTRGPLATSCSGSIPSWASARGATPRSRRRRGRAAVATRRRPAWRVQVERNTALLPVHPVEERRRSATGTVRPTGRLDLDDATPALGQQRTAQRARPQRAEIDDDSVLNCTRPGGRAVDRRGMARQASEGRRRGRRPSLGPRGRREHRRSAGRPGRRAGRARDPASTRPTERWRPTRHRHHPTRATQGPDRRPPGGRARARSSHRPCAGVVSHHRSSCGRGD